MALNISYAYKQRYDEKHVLNHSKGIRHSRFFLRNACYIKFEYRQKVCDPLVSICIYFSLGLKQAGLPWIHFATLQDNDQDYRRWRHRSIFFFSEKTKLSFSYSLEISFSCNTLLSLGQKSCGTSTKPCVHIVMTENT